MVEKQPFRVELFGRYSEESAQSRLPVKWFVQTSDKLHYGTDNDFVGLLCMFQYNVPSRGPLPDYNTL
jgi:hypothetical protein